MLSLKGKKKSSFLKHIIFFIKIFSTILVYLVSFCLKKVFLIFFFIEDLFIFLGNYLTERRHLIVMLICLYLKNLVHLCCCYLSLELPVVWIPWAKNCLPLLVEGQNYSTINCQKSFLNVIILGTNGFWATMHP